MADHSQQAILLAFDKLGDEAPVPARVVAAELNADESAVADRLAELEREGFLASGVDDGTTYWWAKLAPELDPDLAAELATESESETHTHEEISDWAR